MLKCKFKTQSKRKRMQHAETQNAIKRKMQKMQNAERKFQTAETRNSNKHRFRVWGLVFRVQGKLRCIQRLAQDLGIQHFAVSPEFRNLQHLGSQ